MSNVNKIFGPPGAGKTTYLLNVVDKELGEGVASERIGYFSFTRKASTEARDRAIKKFPHLNAKTNFPYFRTLHSLAFHSLAVRTDDMMQADHFKDFATQAGIELNIARDEELDFVKTDNPILNEINLARIKGLDLRQHYNQSGLDIEWHHFEFVDRSYRHYKSSRGLLDFTDLLELIVSEPDRLPELEVLIVDEAQDLSRLQWRMVEELSKRAKRTFIAGDDDQAVFTWAGADVNSFLSFGGNITVLDQSYRVPATVHRLADAIVQRIRHRQEKVWKPRDFDGSVLTYHRFEDVPVGQGQWLILGSTNYLLNPVHEWLKTMGILFERNGVSSITDAVYSAVLNWERLRKGTAISYEAVKTVYRYLDTEAVERGHKTFKHGDPTLLYGMQELQSKYGLKTNMIWHQALTKIADDKRDYLISVLKRGGNFSDMRRVRLSTIHGAKGGEADNVLLLMDLSPKFAKEYAHNSDNIHRLFYVGVTRAKQSLHLVMPQKIEKGFRL
jgi:DNA helicase II / ATP-dependent DNA helicase PcrA